MPPKETPKHSDLALLLSLGWVIAVWITGGVLLGRWADQRWEWHPWGSLGGALAGIAGSGYSVFRVVRQLDRGGPRETGGTEKPD